MNIAGVNYESIVDTDDGYACVIFISGCLHNCAGCHNPNTHDFNYGKTLTDDYINEINQQIDRRPYLKSIVLSGGDPMYSAKEITEHLLPRLHIGNKKLWCYSGFTINEIQQDENMNNLLYKCDVLVDGLFDMTKRDVTLVCRGSSNQRIWRKNGTEWKED